MGTRTAERSDRRRILWWSLPAGVGVCLLATHVSVQVLAERSPLAAWSVLALGILALALAVSDALRRWKLALRSIDEGAVPGVGRSRWIERVVLVGGSALFCLLVLELGLWVSEVTGRFLDRSVALHVPCGDCPEIYRLNPEHPSVNRQGRVGAVVEVPKPEGAFRIVVLGDSVTYGPRVAQWDRFTEVLQERVRHSGIEVVNAGVSGYTAYNELQLYRRLGRELEPDLTLIVFCMNDVVNPRLHWGYTRETLGEIPVEAVPDPKRDRALRGWWRQRRILRVLQRRLATLFGDAGEWTRITGEDSLSIEVLLDEGSAEWHWLRGIYDQLAAAVVEDSGRLAVVVVPLAYQLDPGHPHRPQEAIARYLQSRGLPGLDLLPAFQRRAGEKTLEDRRSTFVDLWHLSAEGHALVAEELESFLKREHLIPLATGSPPARPPDPSDTARVLSDPGGDAMGPP